MKHPNAEIRALIYAQAITVSVGTNESGNALSSVDLYPGGIVESIIVAQDYCSGMGVVCQAALAGLYDINDLPAVWEWGSVSALNQTGVAEEVVDTMSIEIEQGLITVDNSTISAVHREYFEIPSGFSYTPQVGILSLGQGGDGTKPFNYVTGQNFPGYLATQNITSSNSFGLHYGSASLGLGGSLVWDGYDQSRVIGKIGVFQHYQQGDLVVPLLLDIQIGVENGTSPLNNSNSITSLLQLNESFNGFQSTIVNPLVPYFFLPETCANIAQHLLVKLQPDIGLYIRNTDDPQTKRVVQSPTYPALVFQSTSGYLTIKIPFQLLNLSLEPSIVSLQQKYFPCQPFHASDGSGNYYLGRAFLQATFLSINWDSGNFFLAQGPGPAAAEPNIKSIQPKDTNLDSDPISGFLTAWNKTWTPLASQSQSTNTDTSAKPPGNNTSKAFPSKRGGLSDRLRAGIGDLDEKEAGTVYKEAGGEGLPHETPTDSRVHEM
ncbi:hypothetical protein OEA41_008722 [Lepraria neglecta]|uniref:Peptidase A1 domain-containing protein n=1 Tax=Lepraria neglecta TaxID=209136 RepID=A0AAD9Z0K5_9LECA|nr:hypothetical protein OEA41_008722 [Lepraria neglecta]